MSYYPILKIPGCVGSTTLFNFSPNNWERRYQRALCINATWVEGDAWRSECIGTLAINESRTLTEADIAVVKLGSDQGIFLSLTRKPMSGVSSELPTLDTHPVTVAPAWRATVRLSTPYASTCYQGEIDPFPIKGSLLSFCPFLQNQREIENFLIFLNIEKSPAKRGARLEIIDPLTMSNKGDFEVFNNTGTSICLDNLGLVENDLPLIICRGMSAIPLYFSRTRDGSYLSMEHTHPPASFAVHGDRWEVQKLIKNRWLSKVKR